MAAAEFVAGAANPYHAAHTRMISPAALRLPQPKLPGNSNHIARGRIRRFNPTCPASQSGLCDHVRVGHGRQSRKTARVGGLASRPEAQPIVPPRRTSNLIACVGKSECAIGSAFAEAT